MIFAIFCVILHQFWANKLSKILIYIESTNDSMLLILLCPRAMIKVFFRIRGKHLRVLLENLNLYKTKNSDIKKKIFEKFWFIAVRKGTCFALGVAFSFDD